MKAVSQRKLGKLDSDQRDSLIRGVLAGKDVRRAALDAGYSETTAEGRIYQIMKTRVMRERFRRIANAAALDTNEIIGTLVQHMRFDFSGRVARRYLTATSETPRDLPFVQED